MFGRPSVFQSRRRLADVPVVEIADAVKMHDALLASKPESARHDSDICQFCVEKASQDSSTASRIPPASGGPDVSDQQKSPTSTEGGTPKTMSETASISQETHQALLQKAVADATAATDSALETKTTESAQLTKKVEELETDNASLKADNDRLNKELDTAQVSLKTTSEKVEALEADISKMKDDASKAELASKRADQVKNLGLFEDDYVAEKASSWADLAEDDWADRLESWQKLKPASAGEGGKTDNASAMSGTTESLTKESGTDAAGANSGESKSKTPARRAVLNLT